jgi:Peroxisomal biogenesis factor 11 (PEX11)
MAGSSTVRLGCREETRCCWEMDLSGGLSPAGRFRYCKIYFAHLYTWLFANQLVLQLDAMGVWETQWAKDVFIESQKWWFYSYILSIMVSTVELFFPTESSSSSDKKVGKNKDEKTENPELAATKREAWPIVNSLIVDSCDIIIPGSFLGWIQASPTQVGIVMIVTTVLSSRDIWNKANA